MFYNCCFSVFTPWSSVTFISITLFPTLQCLLCSELLPNQSSSFPSKNSGVQRSPLAMSSAWSVPMLSQSSDKVRLLQAALFALWAGCVLSAKSPSEHRSLTGSLEGPLHSLLHQAPPAAWTSFLTPCDHSFCPPQLLRDGSGMCLTTNLPLQQRAWAPVPREAQPGFLLSLQTPLPWFCHPGVIPVASYSFGTLLAFTGPGLYHLLTLLTPLQYFFLTKIWGWILHLFPDWYNGFAVRLSWPGSWDPSGIWSPFTGICTLQWVSWWSLKGIVGKGKFSAIGKKTSMHYLQMKQQLLLNSSYEMFWAWASSWV